MMIGQHLVTKQTGPEGKLCSSVLIAERKFPRREFYFAFALSREHHGPVLIASRFGGVNIEDIAADSPSDIICEPVDQCKGFTKEMAVWVARRVGITDQPEATVKMLCNLYDLFVKKDLLLAEINPYTEDVCQNFYALDCKLTFDENAKFRQQKILCLVDKSQQDGKEVCANELGVNYIALDGRIGCMVNGAGLAMATMDILKLNGGNPANFLDIGGSATSEKVVKSIRIILLDPKVRSIFINIYGGIMRCDTVVEGLLTAIRTFEIKIPIVVRLEGTMKEEGKKMICDADTNVILVEGFNKAAQTAVRCSKIMHLADCGDLEASLKMKLKCVCEPMPKPPCQRGLSPVQKMKRLHCCQTG